MDLAAGGLRECAVVVPALVSDPELALNLVTAASKRAGVKIVRAVWRAIVLLRAFSAERPKQTLTELAQAASLDKNTTRRILHTLEIGGLIEHRDGLYSLGYGLLELFAGLPAGGDLREAAFPILKQLAEESAATAFFWIYRDGSALCIERVRPSQPKVDGAWTPPGSRLTLNSGGGPLALLANIGPAEQDMALDQVLLSRTPFSLVDPVVLRARAAEIERDGYAYAENDFLVGLAGLGAPVFDQNGTLVGALSISSSCEHIAHLVADGYVAKFKQYAASIGLRT
jgi:DNA-binding IclR family transcriptional regulator